MHHQFAASLDAALDRIAEIQRTARDGLHADPAAAWLATGGRPTWPMIVLRTPKGWTGPKVVDGVQVEGTFRAHQVPLGQVRTSTSHREQLQRWMQSYRPEELFDHDGQLVPALQALAPKGDRRMGANPHANGGLLLRELSMPDFRSYAVPVHRPAIDSSPSTCARGGWRVTCSPAGAGGRAG